LLLNLNNNRAIMEPINKFRAYIKAQGLRKTPERETIIEEIFSIHDHFDVDELFLRLRNKRKRVSKASLYRTIPLLIESGLIKEVYFEDGHLHYEHIYGHKDHSHLRCNRCGRIIEFADDEIRTLQKRIGKKYDFAVTAHRFELIGYCPQCAQRDRVQKAQQSFKKERGKEETGREL
jgi:Fur family transcriptional regulator, ferric uptake regulator